MRIKAFVRGDQLELHIRSRNRKNKHIFAREYVQLPLFPEDKERFVQDVSACLDKGRAAMRDAIK